MLLADADVEEAVGKLLCEVQEPGRRRHRGGDGADLGSSRSDAHQRLAEDVGVRHLGRTRPACQRVERADAVELVHLILDGGSVAVSFLRHHVHDHRLTQFLGSCEDLFQSRLVVAVNQPRVLDAEAFEHRRRLEQLLQTFLDAVRRLVSGRADQRKVAQQARDIVLDPLVSGIDAQLRQVAGEAAHSRGVGAAVVVDHDDQVRRLQMGDLVERLVSHTAGECAIADHRDHEPGLTLAQPCLGDAERVAQ